MKSKTAATGRPGTGRKQVRIIAGQYRRRLLAFPESTGLRPTPDRVRETLFNWLGQELHGWHCLDLFAGSGALGFEAASRGAARVVLVEQAPAVLRALRDNQALLAATSVEVVAADSLAWLAKCQEHFDIVFLDPPFAAGLLPGALAGLAPRLRPCGQVYLEGAEWPDLSGWEVLREGRAGVVRYGLLCPRPTTV